MLSPRLHASMLVASLIAAPGCRSVVQPGAAAPDDSPAAQKEGAEPSGPAAAAVMAQGPMVDGPDPTQGPFCANDQACQLVASLCGSCRCEARMQGQTPRPSCREHERVNCAVNPCLGKLARCVEGRCQPVDENPGGV